MPRQEHTLRSLRSGAVMPDQSSRMNALIGRVATQARQQAGSSIRFPDNASRIRYMQGQISVQQRQAIAPIPPTKPDPPTNVVGTRSSGGQISVSFNPPAFDGDSPILDYTVYASPGGATATGSSSPIIVAGLQNGTSYTFTVKARNAIGISAASASSAPVKSAGLPDAPTNVVAERGNRLVSVKFDPPTNTGGEDINLYTATLYKVSDNTDIGSSGGFGSPITIDSMAAPTITNGTEYYVKVSARTAIGTTESGPSNTVIPATTPAAPTGLVTTAGNGYISIAFTAGNNGGLPITKYQYSLNGGTYVDRFITESPLDISGLINGIQYTARIRAVNDVSAGTPSAPTTGTPFLPITVPAAPTNLAEQTIGAFSVVITFTAGANGGSAITNYEYSIDNGSTFTPLSPADASSPITITGLTPSTTYNIKLRAVNREGSGTASDMLSVSTIAHPGLVAPTLTYALPDNGATYIYFDAGATNGDTLTNYEYSIDSGAFIAVSPADTISPIKISGLQNGTTYSIKLRAISSFATSPDSNALSVTPTATTARTAELYYDISAGAGSYSSSDNTKLYNIGSAGTMTGTLQNITYNASIRGGILDFTGVNGRYITFPSYNFGDNITVSAWVYPRTKNDIAGLFTNAGAQVETNGFKFQWNWWQTNSRTIGLQAGNGSQGGDYFSPQNTLTYNTWQHLTYVFDRVNTKFIVFLNGFPTNMATSVNTVSNINTNAAFNIGGYTGGSYTMNARLGSIKIYTELFTAADVLAEFNATKTRFATPASPTTINVDSVIADGTGFIFTATISFTAPSDVGASAITNYKYSLDNGSTYTELNPEDLASPITLNYLQSGTYQLKLRAVNAYGDGAESEPITLTVGTQGPPPPG